MVDPFLDVPFSQPAYAALETLAEAMDVSVPEATRRALILLDTYCQLNADQYLAIVGEDGGIERLRFRWETAHPDGESRLPVNAEPLPEEGKLRCGQAADSSEDDTGTPETVEGQKRDPHGFDGSEEP